jgi:hypothetical protein
VKEIEVLEIRDQRPCERKGLSLANHRPSIMDEKRIMSTAGRKQFKKQHHSHDGTGQHWSLQHPELPAKSKSETK